MVVLRIGAASDISMALFTRMSTLPKVSKAFLAMAFMLASLLTSVGTKRALPGPLSLLINSAASMPIWGVRDAITTLAPTQARDLEIPRPMLLDPPVTTATSPARVFLFNPVLSTVRGAVTSLASILTSSLGCFWGLMAGSSESSSWGTSGARTLGVSPLNHGDGNFFCDVFGVLIF